MSAGQRIGPQGGQTHLQNSAPSATTTTTRPQAVLHLRGAPKEDGQGDGEGSERRRIQWAEDVIDNEGMGKKKSKGMLCGFNPMIPYFWAS
jgi:protein phosphatase 1 regulatory subunit 11